MNFQDIKSVVRYALDADTLAPAEQAAVKAAIQSDSNKQRASLLVEMLNLQSV